MHVPARGLGRATSADLEPGVAHPRERRPMPAPVSTTENRAAGGKKGRCTSSAAGKAQFVAQWCTHKPCAVMQYGDTPQWQLLQQGETGRGCSFSPSGAASSSGGAAIVTRCHCSLPLHCCAAMSSPSGRREGVAGDGYIITCSNRSNGLRRGSRRETRAVETIRATL